MHYRYYAIYSAEIILQLFNFSNYTIVIYSVNHVICILFDVVSVLAHLQIFKKGLSDHLQLMFQCSC